MSGVLSAYFPFFSVRLPCFLKAVLFTKNIGNSESDVHVINYGYWRLLEFFDTVS